MPRLVGSFWNASSSALLGVHPRWAVSCLIGRDHPTTIHTIRQLHNEPDIESQIDYRPPTKLREGSVFGCVCLSVCVSVCPGPDPLPSPMVFTQPCPQTCSNLFNLDLTIQGPPPLLPAGPAGIAGSLKCLLVLFQIFAPRKVHI